MSRDSQRNYSLALLNSDGEIKKFVDLHDARDPPRAHRPKPAYYPLNCYIDLAPGQYMLMAGDSHKRRVHFSVNDDGIIYGRYTGEPRND